jgi:hypothetical protein
MRSPDPFSLLIQELDSTDSFTDGARKIATFIRTHEERCEAPQLISSLVNAATLPRQRERLLFCLLDVSRADFDVLVQALRLRNLRRLYNKAAGFPHTITAVEHEMLTELAAVAGIKTIDDLVAAGRRAATTMRCLGEGEVVETIERTCFALLLTGEASLLKLRTGWLSGNVDPYNMRAIARLLPMLTICDEQASVLNEIADRLKRSVPLGRSVLTIEYAMKTDIFEKWLKKTGAEPSLHPLLKLISQQRTKLIPIRVLTAVATLSRALHDSTAPELTWISHALSCCASGGFRMETGNCINQLKPLLDSCKATRHGSVITGNFTQNGFATLISTDMLPRHLESETAEPSPRELILRSLNNDALLLRLLENPKIAGTPGIVAHVAYSSRSLAVLQKIAITPELYSGYANNDVPLALLRNPTHVPLLHLRQFINTKYVSLNDMKSILHNPYGIRREIFEVIKHFVEQRYR